VGGGKKKQGFVAKQFANATAMLLIEKHFRGIC
jgi:hypothetical protein